VFHALDWNDYCTVSYRLQALNDMAIFHLMFHSVTLLLLLSISFPISLSLTLILDLSHTTPICLRLYTLPQLSAGCCSVHTFDQSRLRSVYLSTSITLSCQLQQPTSPPWTLRKLLIETTNIRV